MLFEMLNRQNASLMFLEWNLTAWFEKECIDLVGLLHFTGLLHVTGLLHLISFVPELCLHNVERNVITLLHYCYDRDLDSLDGF